MGIFIKLSIKSRVLTTIKEMINRNIIYRIPNYYNICYKGVLNNNKNRKCSTIYINVQNILNLGRNVYCSFLAIAKQYIDSNIFGI